MVMLPWLCFTIGACEMGLLLHSSVETPFFTKTFVETLQLCNQLHCRACCYSTVDQTVILMDDWQLWMQSSLQYTVRAPEQMLNQPHRAC
jgi:hypothetical protein